MNNIEICKYIYDNIHRLCQTEIDEIFKILHKNNCSYTQNNNGVFVNLNWLDDEILINIKDYISFCLCSQKEITKYESIKNKLSDKLIKDKHQDLDDEDTNMINDNTTPVKNSKISSSMKFYLLKKKFQKKSSPIAYNNNVLTYEEYIF